MKTPYLIYWLAPLLCLTASCSRPESPKDETPFAESTPDTTIFTNAEFIYNGDDIGEEFSDGWVIKLFTDMDIDDAGAPIGPGCVVQLLLNAEYNPEQKADPKILEGRFVEMANSGNFAPYTFVNGYMSSISLPGGAKIEMADATFYADVKDGSTEMDYDLLDEGAVEINENEDGTFTMNGVLVGNKYTKRYFTWTGVIEARNNVPEEIPNSTLKHDMTGLSFSTGLLQDKGDYFYLQDQSYRCLLLYLTGDDVSFSYGKPTGTGSVLRLEVLVSWDTDFKEGIPEGTYTMIQRNEDTSMHRSDIVPGGAVAGLPNVFEAWKLSGCWYYEIADGAWTQTYARIDKGTIAVERGQNGSHTITYDLLDCQKNPKRITGTTSLETLETYK